MISSANLYCHGIEFNSVSVQFHMCIQCKNMLFYQKAQVRETEMFLLWFPNCSEFAWDADLFFFLLLFFFFFHFRCVYWSHSGVLLKGHSDAVAIKPWRRVFVRDLWSSSLQHGTIVPEFNGFGLASDVPIKVPVIIQKMEFFSHN